MVDFADDDTLTVAEEAAVAVADVAVDATTLTETVGDRTFAVSDTLTVTDSGTYGLAKDDSDAFTFSDDGAQSHLVSETVTVTELAAVAVTLPASDTFEVDDRGVRGTADQIIGVAAAGQPLVLDHDRSVALITT